MEQVTKIMLACCLLMSSAFAQTNYQKELINSVTTLTEQINIHPGDGALYAQRSKAIFWLNSTKPYQGWVSFALADAIKDVNYALELNPGNASLYSLRAEYKRDIYLDYRGAINDMNTAIQLQPDNPQWYLQRASYRKLIYGCEDYKQCADMNDKLCIEFMRQVCTNEEQLVQ